MYGQFTTTQLQKYAKDQAARLRRESRDRKKAQDEQYDDDLKSYQNTTLGKIRSMLSLVIFIINPSTLLSTSPPEYH